MKKIPMLSMDDPNFVEKLADAIGAKPGEPIEIITPQFERPKGVPEPASPPDDWNALRSMNKDELKKLGLGVWGEDPDGTTLMLLPGEWHAHIPEGFVLECINGGKKVVAGRDYIDNDIRFGCLAYGIRVKA